MQFKKITLLSFISLGLAIGLQSCQKDEDETIEVKQQSSNLSVPATYEFLRFDSSSVYYGGQTARLNQVEIMKKYVQDAIDLGRDINSADLISMYKNENGNANGLFPFSSSKQLMDKTFALDTSYFLNVFLSAEKAADSLLVNATAADGKPGVLSRSNGSKILLDSNGHEYTQAIEKGLMGATFYHQIANVYLSDSKIGAAVDNTTIKPGENYTDMEHHMDEAFGYFGAPIDFKSNYPGVGTVRMWAKYSNTSDGNLGMNDLIMDAFKTARAAITEKDYTVKDNQVKLLQENFERLIAATTIHYINSSLSQSQAGDRMHSLSEAYYFLKALKYASFEHRKTSQADLNNMLNNQFGMNLWRVSSQGLNQVKNTLSNTYNLSAVADQL